MAPGQEANISNYGKSIDLLHNNCMLSVLIRIASKNVLSKQKCVDGIENDHNRPFSI